MGPFSIQSAAIIRTSRMIDTHPNEGQHFRCIHENFDDLSIFCHCCEERLETSHVHEAFCLRLSLLDDIHCALDLLERSILKRPELALVQT